MGKSDPLDLAGGTWASGLLGSADPPFCCSDVGTGLCYWHRGRAVSPEDRSSYAVMRI